MNDVKQYDLLEEALLSKIPSDFCIILGYSFHSFQCWSFTLFTYRMTDMKQFHKWTDEYNVVYCV